jgi:RND family efflux transporter MFP subunit
MNHRSYRFVLVVLTLCGCNAKPDGATTNAASKTENAKSQRGGRQGLTYAADVLLVEAKPVTYIVTAPGRIEAFERVQVTARVAGAIDRVGFTEGEQVKRGQVLVLIDSERYQASADGAKAALDKALAAQSDAEAMVNRRQDASSQHPGLIPGEEIETYRTKSVTAKADTQVALQALRTAQLNLRDSSVRAPIEGIIQSRTVETGQYVQAGYMMATLLRKDPMLLRFEVEVADALRIKPGMTATFTMRETQETFSAKITLVAAAADATSHMVPITAELTDKDHRYWLRPGTFCDVTVELEREKRLAPTVPRASVRATDHGYVAYAVENDVAKERLLTLGMNTKDGWIEVRSGLKAGDLLVVRGAEALSDGAKVKATRVTGASFSSGGDASAPASSTSPSGEPHETRRARSVPSAPTGAEARP